MKNRKKIYLLGSIFVLAIISICIFRYGLTSNAGSTSWNFKDSAFKKLGKITSSKTVNGLTLIATSDKPMEVKSNKQTLNGTTFKYCLCMQGMGTSTYRAVKVPVSGNSRIKVTLMSSGNVERTLILADQNGTELGTFSAKTSISLQTVDYQGSRGYVYLYSKNSGINVFKIQVDEIASNDSSSNNDSSNNDSSSDTSNNDSSSDTSNNDSSSDTSNNDSSSDSSSGENSGKTLTITSTIKVAANETYDGKGIKIVAQGMGDGGQAEDQDPIFRLEKGATLKNVIIGAPGCDGIHCYGNNTITNVVWEDVGEDALTVKGGASADAGTITINGGSGKYAADKLFQINAPCTFVVNNFSATDIGKFIRQNGNTTFTAKIYINSCKADTVNCCFLKTDSTTTKIYYSNLTVTNCKKMWDVPNSSQVVEQASSSSNNSSDNSSSNNSSSNNSSDTSSSSSTPSGYTVVASDGSGSYKTLQSAINAGVKNIYVKSGTYKEVVTISSNQSGINIVGENTNSTIFTYDNYSAKSNGNGGTYGTGGSASFFVKGSNINIKNVTISNSYVEKGTSGDQAVALYACGTKNIFTNCSITGNQDTLCLYGGTQYFSSCYIAGDVDFIFGKSQAVFEKCEICSLDRGSSSNNGYITAASTETNKTYGFLFLKCNLTAPATVADNSVYLGRPWCPSGTSVNKAAVAYVNCTMGAHIKTEPWTSMSGVSATHGRFYEYNSSGEGAVVNSSRPQLTSSEVANYTKYNVVGF